MKARFNLFIRFSKDGEPLPILDVKVGEDTYRVFDGHPINGWTKGSMTGHSTDIDIASPGEADYEARYRYRWLLHNCGLVNDWAKAWKPEYGKLIPYLESAIDSHLLVKAAEDARNEYGGIGVARDGTDV